MTTGSRTTEGLNSRQREAVAHAGGPLLVVAGGGGGGGGGGPHPGAHLIQQQRRNPSRILAITFTNRAAGEMKQRLRELVPQAVDDVGVSTIHSACVKILRRDAERIGFASNFTIYDNADSTRFCKRISNELIPWGDDNERQDQARELRSVLSQAKNQGLTPADLAAHLGHNSRTVRAYRLYQQRLEQAKAMDFDDLLLNTLTLLRLHDDVRSRWQQRFDHILVDEYQDTNSVQHHIVVTLAAQHRRMTVVGDPDQSIYAFRGASPAIIEDFATALPDTTTVVLDQNYRSTGNILDAANAVLARHPVRPPRRLRTHAGPGAPVRCHTALDKASEAAFVASAMLKRHIDDQVPFGDMAVLFRIANQSANIEMRLRELAIPYVMAGTSSFYDRREVRDALALLKAAANPADDINLRRAFEISHPKKLLDRVFAIAEPALLSSGTTLHQWMQRVREHRAAEPVAEAVTQFREMIEASTSQAKRPGETLNELLDNSGYWPRLKAQSSEESEARLEGLTSLVATIASHSDINDFLAHVATSDAAEHDRDVPAVRLTTVHAAKGLEFRDVYIIGMQDGALPHSRHKESPGGIGEEVRILYVAMTRAKQTLTLTHAQIRTRAVRFPEQYKPLKPSRFLSAIPSRVRQDSGAERLGERNSRAASKQRPMRQ